MAVVRAEDSGEQPGSHFDVTLGLGFSGFQNWSLGRLRGMKLGQELGGGRAQLWPPGTEWLQAFLCLLRQLKLARAPSQSKPETLPTQPQFPHLEHGAKLCPSCSGTSSKPQDGERPYHGPKPCRRYHCLVPYRPHSRKPDLKTACPINFTLTP